MTKGTNTNTNTNAGTNAGTGTDIMHTMIKRELRRKIHDMTLSPEDESRVIEMAWEDRTPFEAITRQYGLTESQVIRLMRQQLKPRSFKVWRARVSGRSTKHGMLRHPGVSRGYCPTQYKHRSSR